MTIKIENRLQRRIFGFNVEKNLESLLAVVPKSHLFGLEKVIIVDDIRKRKGKKKASAIYKKKYGREQPSIEISFDSVYRGMPKIFFLLPFTAKFTLATVLYHEIGHHYHHRYKHGINKENKEVFAENYKKEMLKKAFWGWALILRPINPVIRYLLGRQQKTGT